MHRVGYVSQNLTDYDALVENSQFLSSSSRSSHTLFRLLWASGIHAVSIHRYVGKTFIHVK